MINTEMYWLSAIDLFRAWRELLEIECSLEEDWEQLLERKGDNEAAVRFRLDMQVIHFRDDCLFYEVEPVNLIWLVSNVPTIEICDALLEEYRHCLNDALPAISLREL